MYKVIMEKECGCFKKSEFENNQTFDTMQDAYKYANLAAEVMSEDFCGTHTFYAQRAEDDDFVIRVTMGDAPSIGTSCSTPASDGWEKESASGGSCGTGCGCA